MTGKLTEEEIGFIARPLVFVDFWTLMFSCRWVWEFEVVSNVICMLLFLFSNGGCPVAPPNQKLFFFVCIIGCFGGTLQQKTGLLEWSQGEKGEQILQLDISFLVRCFSEMHLKSGVFCGVRPWYYSVWPNHSKRFFLFFLYITWKMIFFGCAWKNGIMQAKTFVLHLWWIETSLFQTSPPTRWKKKSELDSQPWVRLYYLDLFKVTFFTLYHSP